MEIQTIRSLRRGFMPATVLGAFPFVFGVDQLFLNPLLLIYGLLLRGVFAGWCLLAILEVRRRFSDFRGYADFFGSILMINITLTYFCTLVSYVSVLRKSGFLKSIFRSFATVDRKLLQMKHTCTRDRSYAFDVFVVSSAVAAGILRYSIAGNDALLTLPYDVCSPLDVYATVIPFLQTVAFIKSRLADLKYLLPLVKNRSHRCQLIRLHNALCNKCRLANHCFGIQLLWLYIVIFNNVVTNCYTFSGTLASSDPSLTLGIHVPLLLFYGGIGWWVTKACNDTASEAKEFNNLLYQMMMEDGTKVISTERIFRLHVSMNREVIFTASGFFNIDNSLIHSIIAATTTYLVVLIQFGQPSSDTESTLFSKITENTFFSNTTEIPINTTLV